MTETTDIKALRELLSHEGLESDYHVGVTVTTLRLLLSKADQLEAESKGADSCAEDCVTWMRRAKAAEAELAALKGKQVPVAWRHKGKAAITVYQSVADEWDNNGWPVEKLFSAPQKLVASDSMALAFHQALNDGGIGHSDLEEIKVGLRAALGVYDDAVVKGGE